MCPLNPTMSRQQFPRINLPSISLPLVLRFTLVYITVPCTSRIGRLAHELLRSVCIRRRFRPKGAQNHPKHIQSIPSDINLATHFLTCGWVLRFAALDRYGSRYASLPARHCFLVAGTHAEFVLPCHLTQSSMVQIVVVGSAFSSVSLLNCTNTSSSSLSCLTHNQVEYFEYFATKLWMWWYVTCSSM